MLKDNFLKAVGSTVIGDIFFHILPEIQIWHFLQIVSIGDNLQEISNPVCWEK